MNFRKPTKSEIESKSKQSRNSKYLEDQATKLLAKRFPMEFGELKPQISVDHVNRNMERLKIR